MFTGGTCKSCGASCEECGSLTQATSGATMCTKCAWSYHGYVLSKGKCTGKCDTPNCEQCSASNRKRCTRCVTDWDNGSYGVTPSGKCARCPSGCVACKQSNKCTEVSASAEAGLRCVVPPCARKGAKHAHEARPPDPLTTTFRPLPLRSATATQGTTLPAPGSASRARVPTATAARSRSTRAPR
jgi:hypothetical protein